MFSKNLKTLAALAFAALGIAAAPAAQAQDDVTLEVEMVCGDTGASPCELVPLHERAYHSATAVQQQMSKIMAAEACPDAERLVRELRERNKAEYERMMATHTGHHISQIYTDFRLFLRTCKLEMEIAGMAIPEAYDDTEVQRRLDELERRPPPDEDAIAAKAASMVPTPPEPRAIEFGLHCHGALGLWGTAGRCGADLFLPLWEKGYFRLAADLGITPNPDGTKASDPSRWQQWGHGAGATTAAYGELFLPIGGEESNWHFVPGVEIQGLRHHEDYLADASTAGATIGFAQVGEHWWWSPRVVVGGIAGFIDRNQRVEERFSDEAMSKLGGWYLQPVGHVALVGGVRF